MAEKEYIERGKLLGRMEARLKQLRNDFGNYDHYTDGFDEGCVAVEDAPAADVVEVRHGEWVVTKTEHGWNCAEYPTEFTCSVCGRTEPKEEPYCHCGAKMDGGKTE